MKDTKSDFESGSWQDEESDPGDVQRKNVKSRQGWVTWFYALVGVLVGIVLTAAIYQIRPYLGGAGTQGGAGLQGSASGTNNQTAANTFAANNPGSNYQNAEFPDFDYGFRAMEENLNQMELMHDRMMKELESVRPDYGVQLTSGSSSGGESSGSLAFFLDGKQYSLPYSATNGRFTMNTQAIKDFPAGSAPSISVKITDSSGKILAEFSKPSDFTGNEISYDLGGAGTGGTGAGGTGGAYFMTLSVTDSKGNNVVYVKQSL